MKKTKGFTLIEMLVGIIIIAVTSVGAFEFFRYCRYFIVSAELRLSAVNFSREVIEELDWNAEIADTDDWENDRDLPSTGFGSRLHSEYGGERLYRVEDGTPEDCGYKTIRVRVTWDYPRDEE